MTHTPSMVSASPHSAQQLTAITETIALAFAHDPSWAPILSPDHTDLTAARAYWSLFVSTAQRYPWTFTIERENPAATPGAAAVAHTATPTVAAATVWYPPNAEELTAQEEADFPDFVGDLLGAQKRDEVLAISDLFAAAQPTEPHYYLSLLAAHPSFRGQGLGRKLLAQNLEEIDRLGIPTYLESSNPENNARYMALGYEPRGTITLPSGLTIMTMWREPRAR